MPNTFAYVMLLAWPGIALVLFRVLPRERALIWSILGAYLILPPLVAFDFPLVPPLDKTYVSSLAALVVCLVLARGQVGLLPRSAVGRLLFVALFLSPFASSITNGDVIVFGSGKVIAGVGLHDAMSNMLGQFVALIPLFLGRSLLASELALREILLALVIAGLGYSLPMLLEVRLSPQLNTWVYGFFQHDFVQMMRQGGYRPIVFLPHGLWVAFFAMMAVVAAAALWRMAPATRQVQMMAAVGYLGLVLVACKSMAALLYAVVLVPIVRIVGLRWQLRLAALLAVVTVTYPLLRGANLVPLDAIVAQAQAVSSERAASLEFRLKNEEILLDRASERPLFGWGPWGRMHVYDPHSGELVSTVDGLWVSVIGSSGWLGYLAQYGMLSLPLLMLARAARRHPVSPYAGPVALILAFNLVDTLPNATLIAFSWLMCGALLGYAESVVRAEAPTAAAQLPGRATRPRAGRTIL